MNNKYRFALYEHTLIYKEGRILRRNFIVIKKGNVIVGWTEFHKYIVGKKKVKAINYNNRVNFLYVIKLLNYVFFGKYGISKLNEMTSDMIKEFFIDYGLGKMPNDNGNSRSEQTVQQCVSAVIGFLDCYTKKNKSAIKMGELFIEEEVFSKRKRKMIKRLVPTFEIYFDDKSSPIFRDITEGAFKIIMNQVIKKHRNILMLVSLSAFAGLRPSEACNVRRVDSALGAGLKFDYIGKEVINVYIDISRERNLRSDLVPVGGIKKERIQKVYPSFLEIFIHNYNMYMKYIEGNKYEEEYGPLTVNKQGKAFTYSSYYQEFRKVIEECIPIMLQSDDPRVVHYGHLLMEHTLGPHIFRHWFSMKLALYGVTIDELMYWRGDKSPESAIWYINNKSDIVKALGEVVSKSFDYISYLAEREENGD